MRVKFQLRHLICGPFIALLTGCQLLAPYKAPLTPTPIEWKNTYSAPDAGKPAIPPEWKTEDLLNPSEKSLIENIESKELHSSLDQENPIEGKSETSTDINPELKPEPNVKKEPEPSPSMPNFEDVKRDLYNWWEIFQDPQLNELEQQALNSSYTLWSALEKVIQARAQAAINFSPLFPHIGFSPSFSRSGTLVQNPLPTLMSSSGPEEKGKAPKSLSEWKKFAKEKAAAAKASKGITAPSLPVIPNDFRFIQSQYHLPLDLSYEVDLWDQLHNAYYASINNAQAAYQAYLGVLLSLTADVAITYYQVRGLDAQLEVLQGNIRVREEAVKLSRARFNAGLIVYLDVSRAEVELARARSDSDDVKRLRGLQENQLASLVGTPASVFSIAYNPILIPPPVIPRGIPSELLCRRPDIGQAERTLAAAYREVGVAYANFFPSLKLNTALGFSSPFAHQLLDWKSRLWQIGWSVFQTVFDAGSNEANYQYTQSLYRESMANYQETVLKAFQDVEDALVDLKGYADRALDLAVAVKYARLTLELAQMRYNRGLTNYLDVVDAERQMLETEQSAVIVLGSRYISTVMLIRALGGGWGPCETCQENDEE